MSTYKSSPKAFSRKTRILALVAGVLALAVYSLTLKTSLFPGENAALMNQWTGLDMLAFPDHPLWAWFVKLFAGASAEGIVLRENIFSMICGVAAALLVCRLAVFFVHQVVENEDTLPYAETASLAAGAVAGFTFIFSTAIWQSATHLEYRIFDVAFALALFALFIPMAAKPKLSYVLIPLMAIGEGLGLAESAIFIALIPVFLLSIVVHCRKTGKNTFLWAALFILLALVVWLVKAFATGADFVALGQSASAEYKSAGKVVFRLIDNVTHEFTQWFKRPKWLAVIILGVFPFVASAFASLRGLNNERTWSQYFFHIGMTLIVVMAIATPLAPVQLLKPLGILPVAVTTLIAFAAGYMAAYWYLMFRASARVNESVDKQNIVDSFGHYAAPVAGGVLVAVSALAALVNAFSCVGENSQFADLYAKEILSTMGEREWLVTNGLLDDHLRVQAAAQGKTLHLICLQYDNDKIYQKEFAKLVKEQGLKGGDDDLSLVVRNMGIQPFLQDWMKNDKDILSKLAIYGMPDIWYWAGYTPVPQGPLFTGTKNMDEFDVENAKASFLETWSRMKPHLVKTGDSPGTFALNKERDRVERFKLLIRCNMGLAGTDLGVALADVKHDDAAFDIFDLVLKQIDRDNISALFNEFELARAGNASALRNRAQIEKRIKAIVADPDRRYSLHSLSTFYGYIRSPEIFVRMGFGWARSGMMGTAIPQLQRARVLLPDAQQSAILNMMASIYASNDEADKSREIYEANLEKDANDRDALMGLARLSLRSGNMDEAREFVTKAAATPQAQSAQGGVEWALLHILNNDLDSARIAMQKVTDANPKSLQAWSLLAGVLLQQADATTDEKEKARIMDEMENVILPRMESVASSPRDYFVQITRALTLLRKGPDRLKEARDAMVAASMENPGVSETGDMILNADIQLDDKESAERHARTILRRNRDDKLANYVMGSLRLKEGNYTEAEVFLRKSCSQSKPVPAAENDMAEVLRRLQRYGEAEIFARRAVANAPDLYVAWETLGSTLLDSKKNLDEAEECVQKAIDLAKTSTKSGEDVRMLITLAKVQLARGKDNPASMRNALGTIRSLKKREKELDAYDRDQLDQLRKAANVK